MDLLLINNIHTLLSYITISTKQIIAVTDKSDWNTDYCSPSHPRGTLYGKSKKLDTTDWHHSNKINMSYKFLVLQLYIFCYICLRNTKRNNMNKKRWNRKRKGCVINKHVLYVSATMEKRIEKRNIKGIEPSLETVEKCLAGFSLYPWQKPDFIIINIGDEYYI